MFRGKLFHAVGPATENARLPSWRVVRGTRRSQRAAERRKESVATVVTGIHSSGSRIKGMIGTCLLCLLKKIM